MMEIEKAMEETLPVFLIVNDLLKKLVYSVLHQYLHGQLILRKLNEPECYIFSLSKSASFSQLLRQTIFCLK